MLRDFQLEQWHKLVLRMMVRANPWELVTHYVAVPEAGGQKASWQLPHGMREIPLEDWPDTYESLFNRNVTAPVDATGYLFEEDNNPSRVWRKGRAGTT